MNTHRKRGTSSQLHLDIKVNTSGRLGGDRDNLGQLHQLALLLVHHIKTSVSSVTEQVVLKVLLFEPVTTDETGGVTGRGKVISLSLEHRLLLGGETLRDLVLHVAQVLAPQKLEETVVSERGRPGVGKEPVVSSRLSSPSDQLNAVTTNLRRALSGGVDTIGVLLEEGLEVSVLVEASLEGTVVLQLGLEGADGTLGEVLERLGSVLLGPGGARVALSVVALGGRTVVRVIRSTARLAERGTGGIAVVNNPVPGNTGVSTVAAVPGALKDGLDGHDGAVRGLTRDTSTVGEGLHGGEIPARTTVSLVKNGNDAVAPLLTSIEGGGGAAGSEGHEGEEESGGAHGFVGVVLHEERKQLSFRLVCVWGMKLVVWYYLSKTSLLYSGDIWKLGVFDDLLEYCVFMTWLASLFEKIRSLFIRFIIGNLINVVFFLSFSLFLGFSFSPFLSPFLPFLSLSGVFGRRERNFIIIIIIIIIMEKCNKTNCCFLNNFYYYYYYHPFCLTPKKKNHKKTSPPPTPNQQQQTPPTQQRFSTSILTHPFLPPLSSLVPSIPPCVLDRVELDSTEETHARDTFFFLLFIIIMILLLFLLPF